MALSHTVFLALVFGVVALVTWISIRQLVPTRLEERLEAIAKGAGPAGASAPPDAILGLAARFMSPLARPSLPAEQWEKSPLRIRFANAGLRTAPAPMVYFGAKTLLTFLLPGLLLAVLLASGSAVQSRPLMFGALALATIGYYLPNLALAQLIKRRQRELFEAFPDALDLMRVCVQAGLGLDAAIERVGREMALESPALSDEFHLVSLELRAGASRAEALRNLALRVAVPDVDALVAMLVQADRFGTSVSESLRVHSDALRSRRRFIAEEAAAKLPVKLVFPLVLCIFPALLAVLLGPSMISIYRNVLPLLRGAGQG